MRALGLLAALACAGCGGDDGGDSAIPEPPEPSLELGTGEIAFEPLADGDELLIIQGPQGGHHFLGSFIAKGIEGGNPESLTDPSNPTVTFRVFEGDVQRDVGIEFTQGLNETAPFTHTLVGRFVILDIEVDDELDGVELRFEVQLQDVDGNDLTDSRTVVGVPHPLNAS